MKTGRWPSSRVHVRCMHDFLTAACDREASGHLLVGFWCWMEWLTHNAGWLISVLSKQPVAMAQNESTIGGGEPERSRYTIRSEHNKTERTSSSHWLESWDTHASILLEYVVTSTIVKYYPANVRAGTWPIHCTIITTETYIHEQISW